MPAAALLKQSRKNHFGATWSMDEKTIGLFFVICVQLRLTIFWCFSALKRAPPARNIGGARFSLPVFTPCYDNYLSGLGLRATGGCKPRQVRKEATVAV